MRVAEDTQTFSPTWLATVRLSFTRLGNFRSAFSDGFDITKLGLPASLAAQLYPHAFPDVTITGMSITGSIPQHHHRRRAGRDRPDSSATTASGQRRPTRPRSSGNHEIQSRLRIPRDPAQYAADRRQLAGLQLHSDLDPGAESHSVQRHRRLRPRDLPARHSRPARLSPCRRSPSPPNTTRLFVQDSFKVTPRLTLNYGLRWEYETPRTDRFNQLTNFDYGAAPPITAAGLEPPRRPHLRRRQRRSPAIRAIRTTTTSPRASDSPTAWETRP